MKEIDWTKQHCGVIQGEYTDVVELMPDLKELLETFPENPNEVIDCIIENRKSNKMDIEILSDIS